MKHPVYDTDRHFTIDLTNFALVSPMKKISLVKGLHNAERFTFDFPRTIEGHDLSLCDSVEVHFLNIDAASKEKTSPGTYKVNDIEVYCQDGEEKVIFSWLIDGRATQYDGVLNFAIHFKCTRDGKLLYKLPTAVFSGILISDGVDHSEAEMEDYQDVVTAWMHDIEQSIDDKAREAIDKVVAETVGGAVDKAIEDALEGSVLASDNLSNALKGNASGTEIIIDDLSPIASKVKVSVGGEQSTPNSVKVQTASADDPGNILETVVTEAGAIVEVEPIFPAMIIKTDSADVHLSAEYNKDTNAVIAELREAIEEGGGGTDIEIVHELGDSEDAVMSQKAVTEAVEKAKSVVNITSIDTIYESVEDLPATASNGTTYVVANSSEKATYAFDASSNTWNKKYDLKAHTVYCALSGAKAGLYRFTMSPPYLLSAESHTLQEAKDYADSLLGIEIVHELGDSEDAVMSQKAVTDEVNRIESAIDEISEVTGSFEVIEEITETLFDTATDEFIVGTISSDGSISSYSKTLRTPIIDISNVTEIEIVVNNFVSWKDDGTSRSLYRNDFSEDDTLLLQEKITLDGKDENENLVKSAIRLDALFDKSQYPTIVTAKATIIPTEGATKFCVYGPSRDANTGVTDTLDLQIICKRRQIVTTYSRVIKKEALPSNYQSVEILQEPGDREDAVMSQKAATSAINAIKEEVDSMISELAAGSTEEITKNLELRTSENLCNPDEVVSGGYVETTGVIKTGNYKYTGKISVSEGDVLTFFRTQDSGKPVEVEATRVCVYDSSDNAISDAGASKVYSYTVPNGIESVIVSFSSTMNGIMVLKNYDGTPLSYIVYESPSYVATEEFLNDLVYSKEEVDAMVSEVKSGSTEEITKKLTLRVSENLCNPDEEAYGLIDVTGVANTNTTYKHTGNISVSEGDVLTFFRMQDSGKPAEVEVHRVCAYDRDGSAVSNVGVTKVKNYTVPSGITSVVISCYATYEGFMVLRNYEGTPSVAISYEPPSYVATEEFLKGAVTWDVLDDEIKNKIVAYNPIETDYINEEIERVKRETLRDDGVLNFIFSTDQHIKANLEEIHIVQEIARVADLGQFDFICMGGDMIQAGDTSWYRKTDANGNVIEESIGFVDKKPIVLSNMTEIANILKDAKCPVFYCQGNHDVCFGAYHGARDYNAYYGYAEGDENYKNPDDQSLLPKTFFRLFNNRLGESVVWDSENPLGGYFYKDFERSKIRVIVLQTQDVFNDDGSVVDTVNNTSLNPRIQQKQFSWFCNKALDFMDKGEDRTNWAVVIVSHVNVTLGGISGGSIGNEQCVLIRGVINAFMTGGIYDATTPDGFMFPLSASVDFTEQGAVDFICSINGHVHADTAMDIGEVIDGFTGYDEPAISRPSIQVSSANGTLGMKDYSASALKDYFILPERVEGTISCECFDIFSIDRKNRKIKTIRFGAGENREIDY